MTDYTQMIKDELNRAAAANDVPWKLKYLIGDLINDALREVIACKGKDFTSEDTDHWVNRLKEEYGAKIIKCLAAMEG